jgi:hypothetical protein
MSQVIGIFPIILKCLEPSLELNSSPMSIAGENINLPKIQRLFCSKLCSISREICGTMAQWLNACPIGLSGSIFY